MLMTRRETRRMLAAVLAAGALACDGTTGPEGGGAMTDLPVTHDMELQVVGDSDVSDLLVEGLALHAGRNPDDAQFRAGTDCFREARRLLRAGETVSGQRVVVYPGIGLVLTDTIEALLRYPFG